MSVILETTIGSITIDLCVDERPRTCLNFLKLCKLKYYNFCTFHKIIKDFIVQSGRNIFNGNEIDSSIYYFIHGEKQRFYKSETKKKLKNLDIGTVSMVNTEDGLIGSEFFITLSKDLNYLDNQHTVFGHVVDGLEVLYKLNQILCDNDNIPYKNVLITHTIILDDPFDDPVGLLFPELSPEPTDELLTSQEIFLEQEFDENYGKSNEELEEEIKNKEAKSRAIILEMVGDLPDADVLPPDNVLFVCKLNPVTREEDLRVIFSRFGKILDCEVIKDSKTKESLQYGFIEFENAKDCEKAYFKMDNVLIDDRRIHVDFSQSVMKYKWNKKIDKNSNNRKKYINDSDKKQVRRYSRSRSREKHHSKNRTNKSSNRNECDHKSFRNRSRSNSTDKISRNRYKDKSDYNQYSGKHNREKKNLNTNNRFNRNKSSSTEKHQHRNYHRTSNEKRFRNKRSDSEESEKFGSLRSQHKVYKKFSNSKKSRR